MLSAAFLHDSKFISTVFYLQTETVSVVDPAAEIDTFTDPLCVEADVFGVFPASGPRFESVYVRAA
jgi:hypothetical protein